MKKERKRLPRKWCAFNDGSKRFKTVVIEYINKEYDTKFDGTALEFYGYDGDCARYETDSKSFGKGAVVLDLDEIEKILFMKTQKSSSLKTLPKTWCVMNDFSLKFRLVIDYLNTTYDYKFDGSFRTFYGFDGIKPRYSPNASSFNKPVILTPDDFIRLTAYKSKSEVKAAEVLPGSWAVQNDGTQRFKNTVIKYINMLDKRTSTTGMTGISLKGFYGHDGRRGFNISGKTAISKEKQGLLTIITIDELVRLVPGLEEHPVVAPVLPTKPINKTIQAAPEKEISPSLLDLVTDELPKSWVVLNDGTRRFRKVVLSYLNTLAHLSGKGAFKGDSVDTYYGHDGKNAIILSKALIALKVKEGTVTVLSIDDFVKLAHITEQKTPVKKTTPKKKTTPPTPKGRSVQVSIFVPEGHELIEESIKFKTKIVDPFAGLPEHWEDIPQISGAYIDKDSELHIISSPISTRMGNRNVWPSEAEALASRAAAQLCQMRDAYNGGAWRPSPNTSVFYVYRTHPVTNEVFQVSFLYFPTAEMRDHFQSKLGVRALLRQATPLIFPIKS